MNLAIDDLATAYRWLDKLEQQANHALPLIRKTLLELSPEHKIGDELTPKPAHLTSRKEILNRLQNMAQRLLKAAVHLIEDKTGIFNDSFCFLNYFLAQTTGKALLQL